MAAWGMATGGIFIPLGMGLIVLNETNRLPPSFLAYGLIFLALGTMFLVHSFKATIENDNRREREAERRHSEIMKMLNEISRNTLSIQNDAAQEHLG